MNKEKQTPEYYFKILVIGETGVGKTCLILRYSDDIFYRRQLSTIGIDFKIKEIIYNNKEIKVLIWDTAGQERFRNITNQYYSGADGVLWVFDVGNRDSFEKTAYWMNQIKEKTEKDKISCILVGNKTDTNKREVAKEEGEVFARNCGWEYRETSALSNLGVNECFGRIVNLILSKKGVLINSEGNGSTWSVWNDEQNSMNVTERGWLWEVNRENEGMNRNCLC